ncbi:MAG: glutamate 5-kinase [Candidatus Harrisonbacteria bacterium CG10_big_fil_rev_8_21_14_0_10_49_15]|uniref:Glutamate 5-kinase n=1 Tax=Candidatus Harrisonbacteria bacterium CG10_big_fil_rev_8_21_14_0_10_49_15 TaxID=1974587 RepID=A0A2H0ULT2_9BACT|nr:MAG: glutamate 5-kinase [Candidatus Harrisonbacteria bacterium CG10_big_fil_rev_8_21_14_0_10_49_15]
MSEKELFVVKVGSNTVVDDNGEIRTSVIQDILSSIKELADNDHRVILVTSGAVKLGRKEISDPAASLSSLASIGQVRLFGAYLQEAEKCNVSIAQFLLARPYIVERKHFLNLQKTVRGLFANKKIPVINENDALVANTDWSFGDNDSLAAAVAIAFEAKKLIIVSHIDGLFNADPQDEREAKLIPSVTDVNAELLKCASKNTSSGGRGGMFSKLKAARIITAVGIQGHIINGSVQGNLRKVMHGESVGTVFLPRKRKDKISNRDRWLLAAKNSAGSLEVDNGAIDALKKGKSLLAVGVKKVHGQFGAKEIIEIVDTNKQGVAFGIVDFSNKEIDSILDGNDLYGKLLMHSDNILRIA